MPEKSKFSILSVIYAVLLCLSVFGIWYLYKKYILQKKQRRLLFSVREKLNEANAYSEGLVNFDSYFAFSQEQLYTQRFKELRKLIVSNFIDLGLGEEFEMDIKNFIAHYDGISLLRKNYNDEFVTREASAFRYLFDSLEEYPLSDDQIEAVVRDEDNNLIIAGAGTGKTTTISAKTAYILEKGLAKPEELLIISFTKNAVKEMYDRCVKFCKNIEGAEKLDVRTFNSFGYLVKRHCSKDELQWHSVGTKKKQKFFYRRFLTNFS